MRAAWLRHQAWLWALCLVGATLANAANVSPGSGDTEVLAWFVQVSDLHLCEHYCRGDKTRHTDLLNWGKEILPAIAPAYVVVSGDLTEGKPGKGDSGMSEKEWQMYQDFVQQTEAGKIRVLDTRGNHDRFNGGPRGGGGDLFAVYGAGTEAQRLARAWSVDLMPRLQRVGSEWRVADNIRCPAGILTQVDFSPELGLRSPFTSWGQLTAEMEKEIDEELRTQSLKAMRCSRATRYGLQDVLPIVAFGHFPLSCVTPMGRSPSAQGFLASRDVSVYLSGHLHRHVGDSLHRRLTVRDTPDVEHYFFDIMAPDWKVHRAFRVVAVQHGHVQHVDLVYKGDGRVEGLDHTQTVDNALVMIASPPDARYSPVTPQPVSSEIRVLAWPLGANTRGTPDAQMSWLQSMEASLQWACPGYDLASKDPKALSTLRGSLRLAYAGSYSNLFVGQWPTAEIAGCRGNLTVQAVMTDRDGHTSTSAMLTVRRPGTYTSSTQSTSTEPIRHTWAERLVLAMKTTYQHFYISIALWAASMALIALPWLVSATPLMRVMERAVYGSPPAGPGAAGEARKSDVVSPPLTPRATIPGADLPAESQILGDPRWTVGSLIAGIPYRLCLAAQVAPSRNALLFLVLAAAMMPWAFGSILNAAHDFEGLHPVLFWWGIVYRNLEGKVTTVVLPDVVLMTLEQLTALLALVAFAAFTLGGTQMGVRARQARDTREAVAVLTPYSTGKGAASAPRRGASKSAVSEPDTDGQAVQPKRTASRRRGAAAAEEPKTPRDAKTAAGATPPVPATPAAIRAVRRMLGPMPAHDLYLPALFMASAHPVSVALLAWAAYVEYTALQKFAKVMGAQSLLSGPMVGLMAPTVFMALLLPAVPGLMKDVWLLDIPARVGRGSAVVATSAEELLERLAAVAEEARERGWEGALTVGTTLKVATDAAVRRAHEATAAAVRGMKETVSGVLGSGAAADEDGDDDNEGDEEGDEEGEEEEEGDE